MLFLNRNNVLSHKPCMFKADERPLDVEYIVSDHTGFTVFDQELEIVHSLLDSFLIEDIPD